MNDPDSDQLGWINNEEGPEDKDALLSAGFSCSHRADNLQLSATNFQIKTKEALGEGGYCLTLIGPWTMEQPFSIAEVTGGQEEKAVDGGGDAYQASTLLKVAFSGKLPLLNFSFLLSKLMQIIMTEEKLIHFYAWLVKHIKFLSVFQNCIREPFLQHTECSGVKVHCRNFSHTNLASSTWKRSF